MARRLLFDTKVLMDRIGKNIGGLLVRSARRRMDTISYGRRYIIGGKVHIASRPGDPPNNLTGNLRRTMSWKRRDDEVEIGSGNKRINYARILETIKQRPNVVSIIEANKAAIARRLEKYAHESFRSV